MLLGIRPGDDAYVAHQGAVFHPQNENNNLNMAYYEITATDDQIDFDVATQVTGLETPILALHQHWGETDYDLIDRVDSTEIIAEQSGFDNDIWFINLEGTSGKLRLTSFDTNQGVNGTEAAWLPYVELISARA